jgi:hypothetical protein
MGKSRSHVLLHQSFEVEAVARLGLTDPDQHIAIRAFLLFVDETNRQELDSAHAF